MRNIIIFISLLLTTPAIAYEHFTAYDDKRSYDITVYRDDAERLERQQKEEYMEFVVLPTVIGAVGVLYGVNKNDAWCIFSGLLFVRYAIKFN